MSLYLKYRPKTVDELDLAGVRESFNKLINSNVVSHAYLFTGPRGAGKTSSARILARIVNCEKNKDKLGEPCNECSACKSILSGGSLDFIEIDAASNRGIDDIRELKEKIRLAPSELKYKVYIIDEVHMLTTEAFNALLKTLEEPPAHAIFILCTTETHKVPETIQSRCVSIGFTKATPEEMKRSFARVVTGEGKKVSEEALDYLSRSVDGSFRDGVKILDKVLSQSDDVQLAQIEEAIMGVAGYNVSALVEALTKRDSNTALGELHAATARGMDLVYLTITLMKELRNRILAGESKELVKLVFNLDEVARKIANSPVPELLLEMVIIDWGSIGQSEHSEDQNSSKIGKSDAKQKLDPVIKMESGEAKGASVDGSKSPWMQMKEQFLTGKRQAGTAKSSSSLAREDGSVTIDEAIEIFS
ncbi:MAG: DNA polymerase III subunit gamma/tau [Candidatus Moraniibacteriota bacterium]|nr:MAG: DNA polymerase III subunit gamma/tau [Candidatus Moranbacteria bacterium]